MRRKPIAPPLTDDELAAEACLWRLEGASVAITATRLNVAPQTVTAALKRSGAYTLEFPGRGRRKREELFSMPEHARLRLNIPWMRAFLTTCELIFPQGEDHATALRERRGVVMWQRRFVGGFAVRPS